MSIIHEALKKAHQKQPLSAVTESVNKVSVSADSSPWYQKKNIAIGLITLGGISLVYWWSFISDRPAQIETFPYEQAIQSTAPAVVPGAVPPSGEFYEVSGKGEGAGKKTDLRVMMEQGITFFKNGQFVEAEKHFLKMIEVNHGIPETHNALGLVYKTKGKMDLAEKHYQWAIELKPDFAEALNNMAVLYEQRGRDEKAVELFKKALAVKPDYPEGHLNYALLLEKIGKPAQAKEAYMHFLSIASPEQEELVNLVNKRISRL